ncbi:MAG: NAD(P)H-dependent oxidoreductase subunit E [Anaerolineae bacterium]|nr:NAD(P)H-dependent oxidoreductase subunit E [Anaerolineae bacterium]NUQ04198.1 NAD(P)H-dependent oxidoreductase subunit E [Anaerolineae bacterium]
MNESNNLPELGGILGRYAGRTREALLPLLWDIQASQGYISPEAVHAVSKTLRVPEADIYGVIGFYTLFHEQPTGETLLRICTDQACGLAGADSLLADLRDRLSSAENPCTVEHSACLGLCEHAPAVLISRRGKEDVLAAAGIDDLLGDPHPRRAVAVGYPAVLVAGVEDGEEETLARYGDYAGLRCALETMTPQNVVGEVKASGLIGRGGAAFPTGAKWEGVWANPPDLPRYVVGNADESEPGTFKDRVLLEDRPHLLLEGMALCAYAVGARQGYLYVRGEYPEALRRVQAAAQEALDAGFLGDDILGSSFSFHLEIRRGAGAYICGEETALFEAIEGKRGFPRIKPPFPTTRGLFGAPTVINNVETLCAVPGIIRHGAGWFRQWGTERSTGTKLVSVSGHVERPGVYEIVPGVTLRTVLQDYCGGVRGGLKAVLMGGASGTFLTPEEIDVRLTFEDLRAIGATFGSGAIIAYNDSVDLRVVLQRLGRFFQHESCGKCFPCQLGTQRQMEILARAHTPLSGDRRRLTDIGLTMTEASLCGLGQTAASAVLSALEKWSDLIPDMPKGGRQP